MLCRQALPALEGESGGTGAQTRLFRVLSIVVERSIANMENQSVPKAL